MSGQAPSSTRAQEPGCSPSGGLGLAALCRLDRPSISQGAESPPHTLPAQANPAVLLPWAQCGRWWGRADRRGFAGPGAPWVAGQPRRCACAAMACLACVLPATGFTLQSGSYWLETFDSYVASVNLIVLAFFEVVGVACVCGLDR